MNPSNPEENAAAAPEPLYLEPGDGRRIAYHKTEPDPENKRPGVLFLGGFRSDMTGTKAVHLENWAKSTGRAFIRFDYTGHGASSGAFEDGAIGDWARDAEDVLSALTVGPQIVIGSSMGGWIALLLARRAPARIAGLVGVAAAPDFTEDGMWARFSETQRAEIEAVGRLELPSDYSDEPYVITRRLIEDGRDHLVLRDPLRVDAPVRLLQGTADDDVDVSVALRLLDHLEGADIRLTLIKDADHRLSEPRELALLVSEIEGV